MGVVLGVLWRASTTGVIQAQAAFVSNSTGAHPWGRAGQPEGELNLCIGGRFVPEFFLIGVPKAATSNFAANFATSRDVHLPNFSSADQVFGEEGVSIWDDDNATPAWDKEPGFFLFGARARHMPSCFPPCQRVHREVATDMTPGYFAWPAAAGAIYNFYKPWSLHLKLRFMVILREPLRRMHSHYYHKKQVRQCNTLPPTFQWAVHAILTRFDDSCTTPQAQGFYELLGLLWASGMAQQALVIDSLGTRAIRDLKMIAQLVHWLS
eukprot:TRINITY_DN34161_c0_g1_i1.p1 TRINITY_DN34161_c0_g1~~TRINITY_DN34161_c0_g1_i1.p1  ORF type:complete len:290 (-),score=32.38 TRINITY_DN34161_c0_g1_i1:96-893(-)